MRGWAGEAICPGPPNLGYPGLFLWCRKAPHILQMPEAPKILTAVLHILPIFSKVITPLKKIKSYRKFEQNILGKWRWCHNLVLYKAYIS